MTYITSTPTAIRRFSLPRLGFPRFAVGPSLAAISDLLGDAYNLAYVDPYTSRRWPPAAFDNNLEGRDPNW